MLLGLRTGWRWRMSNGLRVQRPLRRFYFDGFEHPVARDYLWWLFLFKGGSKDGSVCF